MAIGEDDEPSTQEAQLTSEIWAECEAISYQRVPDDRMKPAWMKKLAGEPYLRAPNWKPESDLLYGRPYGSRSPKYDSQGNYLGETQRVMRDIIGIKHGKGLITLLTDEADQSEVRNTIARIRSANNLQGQAHIMPSQRGEDVACLAMGKDIALADMDKKMAASQQPTYVSQAAKLAPTTVKRANPKAGLNAMARAVAYKTKGPGQLGMEFYFESPNPTAWKQINNISRDYVCSHQVLPPEEPSIPA